MKKFIGLLAAAVVLTSVAAFAGPGCCGGKAKGADCFAKLNLTADQQTKIDALKADCMKDGCKAASREKMMTGLKSILTDEQYKQFTAACATAKGGCPRSTGAAKAAQ